MSKKQLLRTFSILAGFLVLLSFWVEIGRAIPSAPPSISWRPGSVVVIPIEGEIDEATVSLVEQGYKAAAESNAKAVVFDINSSGGDVSSALRIADIIQKHDKIRSVAWINSQAISASVLIGMACNEMVARSSGRLGDFVPILQGAAGDAPVGPANAERSKIDAYVLGTLQSLANPKNYPPLLCEAMVILKPRIFMIQDRTTSEVRYIVESGLAEFGLKAPEIQNKTGANPGAELVSPPTTGQWELVKLVNEADQPLTLAGTQCLEYGFARQLVENEAELAAYVGVARESISRPQIIRAQQPASTSPATSPASSGPVVIIPIQGEINDITVRLIERGYKAAEDAGARTVVFDMHTPGGAVRSALDITEIIHKHNKIRSVVWINSEAISAGALISVACDEIVIRSKNKFGDCVPILLGAAGGGPVELGKAERAKIDAYVLAEFRSSANTKNYPLLLCEAMVTLLPRIYMIRDRATAEIRYIIEPDLVQYGLKVQDLQLKAGANPGSISTAPKPAIPETPANPANPETPSPSANTPAPAAQWELIKLVNEADRPLTFVGSESIEYGFARKVVEDEAELAAYLGVPQANLSRLLISWSEELTAWLTSPGVRSILMTVFLLGFYMEMQAPGISLPGIVAGIALVLLLVAPYLAGLSNYIEILMVLLGLSLIVVEIFIFPGFVAPAVVGGILVVAGLLLGFVPNTTPEDGNLPSVLPTDPYEWDRLREGVVWLFVSLSVSMIGFWFISKYLDRMPVFGRMVLSARQKLSSQMATAAGGPAVASSTMPAISVGLQGVAITALRPAGRIRLGSEYLDVVSGGGWIQPGAAVRIVSINGNLVTVEEA